MKLLEGEGVDFDRVNYFIAPLATDELGSILGKAGLGARDVLRKRDRAYAELGLDDAAFSEERLLAAIVEHPGLLQRPIVVRGERAVLGRPVERVRELF